MSRYNEQAIRELQQLGREYADEAIKYFGKKYSEQPKIGEIALFYAAATSSMVATMYAFVYANAAKEDADGWLAQLFGMIGEGIQIKRIPVPPSLAPSQDEVSSPAASTAQAEAPPAVCICKLDQAGVCPTCPTQIKASIRQALVPIGDCLRVAQERLLKVGADKLCSACTSAYLDAAIASAVMEGSLGELSAELEPLSDQIFDVIYQWAIRRGLTEMPLTEKAWAVFSERLQEKKPESTSRLSAPPDKAHRA